MKQLMQPPDDYLKASCLTLHHLSIGTTRYAHNRNKKNQKRSQVSLYHAILYNNLLFQLGKHCKVGVQNN